jgi:deoxyribodipyrimidine photo-lyase
MAAKFSIIVWFRSDLRLHDNPALYAAVSQGGRIIPVYIYAPQEEGRWQPGAASRWWLHHSLSSLARDLKQRGSRLILRTGNSLKQLQQLAEQTGATAVYTTRCYTPAGLERDNKIQKALRTADIDFTLYNGNVLIEPDSIHNKSGQPFKVFTPFWRTHQQHFTLPGLLAAPNRLPAVPTHLSSTALGKLELLPKLPWDKGMRQAWQVGEQAALQQLQTHTTEIIAAYPATHDRPDTDGTSRLSPYLNFGELSVRQVAHTLTQLQRRKSAQTGAAALLRQLVWRDFAHHILWHFPATTDQPFNARYNRFPWQRRSNSRLLKAWQQGLTGFPIIDAGMRQLWQTGWMHNRVRMIVASLLSKNAGIHWQLGARWFWDTLVDADLAQNSMNWQWVAGCGVDDAPYFRIFNPVLQSHKFDPRGEYIRRWVPELAALPTEYIHQPELTPPLIQQTSGVFIGIDYPEPMLDLKASREQALQYYRQHIRSSA